MIKVKCEICFEHIADCDINEFKVPMNGLMFKSPASHRGIPPPFHFSMDWLEMRCPWCRKRPFLHQHKFMGTDGKYYGNVHECNYCPRNFTTASGLAIHTKTHERKDAEKERSA